MPIRLFSKQASRYILIACTLSAGWLINQHSRQILANTLEQTPHAETLLILFICVIMFSLGFLVFQLAKATIVPSFVLAIFFGLVSNDTLQIITRNETSLITLITIGAVLILFDGGLDTPFKKFKRLFWPITSLAILGTFINAMLLSMVLLSFSQLLGVYIPLPAVILLGAAIASTDPAAIIPCFKGLQFKKARVKHIAVSESAINDVVGAVIVGIFLTLFLKKPIEPVSIVAGYKLLLNPENISIVIKMIGGGLVAGVIGFGILYFWGQWKQRLQAEEGTDSALFIAVPLFAFTAAETMHGNGYLAVFISGLLFHMKVHFKHVEHYFNHTIEGFMKPMIFMLLGAMVPLDVLVTYAPIGLALGAFTILVLRPLIVLLTLTPFCFTAQKFSWQELAFLSFVRETGVIPAALLITISTAGIPGAEIINAIGLWVILLTLIVQPPLTPLLAKKLCIASDTIPIPKREHNGPVAVLCSRGNSYKDRLKTVVNWAEEHGVENIILLHCPEEKYSKKFVLTVEEGAKSIFNSINEKRLDQGKRQFNFEILCGPGLLQTNIENLIAAGDVSIIFVGDKMLDYRLEDVKNLNVPFYFMN